MARDPFALVGQVLEGQYRVDAVVGEGGCGVVYKGRHLAFEQPIAVKALKMPDLHDAEARIGVLTKFREEARLCYVLSQVSLSIVRCIGYGAVVTPTQAWAPYLVLEWLEGRPLSQEIEERRRRGAPGRPLAEAITLLAPVASGLAYAHSQRVAHRDVKPANLFLLTDDVAARPTSRAQPIETATRPTIKILDFGIAKVMQEGATAASAPYTNDGLASFTPYYAAPEQLDRRFGPTGPWTDVFGFALVLVEVLSGQQPMRGANVMTILTQATNPAQRPTPRALGVAVPDAVEAVFAKALAVDPKARFAEVGPFWEALVGALRLGVSGRHSDGSVAPAWVPPAHTLPMSRVGEPGEGSTLPIVVGGPVPAGGRVPAQSGSAQTMEMTPDRPFDRQVPAMGSWHGRSTPGVVAAPAELMAELARVPLAAAPVTAPARKRRWWPVLLGVGMAFLVLGLAAAYVVVTGGR